MSQTLFTAVLTKLMESFSELKAAAVVDRDGLIITSQVREGIDEDIVGTITAVFDRFITRIKSEFGESHDFLNIMTVDENKFLFKYAGEEAILTFIAPNEIPDQKLKIFAEHIAKKIEMILRGESIDPEIPRIIEMLADLRIDQLPKGNFAEKLIIIGDPQVGKTSLIRRFVDDKFSESYISTIGVDISRKNVVLEKGVCEVTLTIWDIGGQIQTMAPYRKRFYQGVNMAFLQFDITRKKTFDNLGKWLEDLYKSIDKKIPLVLIANKIDLPNHEVSLDEIKQKANELSCPYILTSAKTGENVEDVFRYAAYKLCEIV